MYNPTVSIILADPTVYIEILQLLRLFNLPAVYGERRLVNTIGNDERIFAPNGEIPEIMLVGRRHGEQ